FPATVPALAIGCMLSNLITGCAPMDIVFGSVITLVASIFTCLVGRFIKNTVLKISLGGIFPVLLNAFLLPLIWIWCYGQIEYLYYLQVLFLLISQSVSVYVLGVPLYLYTKKTKDKNISFLQ
ncbi:MAG: QueT transporter family protein, partial [Clostridia bacterium]|nr:QueT transporter family protein [Clostridia bacterium]